MLLAQQEFVHPTQANRVRLAVFQQPPDQSPVEGLPDAAGYLVTEERVGTRKVVSTLGFFESREAALERMEHRARELERQRYRPIAPAA